MKIDVGTIHFKELNEEIHQCPEKDIHLENCLGQRYIGCGLSGHEVSIHGVPGNALGAYLDGANLTVWGNAQDATGDTMNEGCIEIHGSSGDATGYAMRGGMILVEKNVGYRAGIHMKAYEAKTPVLVVGGEAGSFLGEYQAGGYLIVLGMDVQGRPPVGRFCAAGMHGGKIFLRTDTLPFDLPSQVVAQKAGPEELAEIAPYLTAYCQAFHVDMDKVKDHSFYVLTPNTTNPYKRLYTTN